tara:strand:- start:3123 stop:3542 length:420 start_codon:yes stop_codon:yes gene_type:complete
MTDYKATFEQWNDVERWAKSGSHAATAHCILELLSRVESLEEDAYEENKCNHACVEALVRRIEKLENNSRTTPNLDIIRSSLVRKVQRAIDKEYEETLGTGENEAKAAIFAVAKWLREQNNEVAACQRIATALEAEVKQ